MEKNKNVLFSYWKYRGENMFKQLRWQRPLKVYLKLSKKWNQIERKTTTQVGLIFHLAEKFACTANFSTTISSLKKEKCLLGIYKKTCLNMFHDRCIWIYNLHKSVYQNIMCWNTKKLISCQSVQNFDKMCNWNTSRKLKQNWSLVMMF